MMCVPMLSWKPAFNSDCTGGERRGAGASQSGKETGAGVDVAGGGEGTCPTRTCPRDVARRDSAGVAGAEPRHSNITSLSFKPTVRLSLLQRLSGWGTLFPQVMSLLQRE